MGPDQLLIYNVYLVNDTSRHGNSGRCISTRSGNKNHGFVVSTKWIKMDVFLGKSYICGLHQCYTASLNTISVNNSDKSPTREISLHGTVHNEGTRIIQSHDTTTRTSLVVE